MALANGVKRFSLHLNPQIALKLDKYATDTEIPKTRIINRALANFFSEMEEDAEDARLAEKAWKKFNASGEKAITSAELKKRLGL